jgi:hypothetical protein
VRASRQITHTQHVKQTTKKLEGNRDHAPEALIPMGENRITEHVEGMKDF